MKRKHKRDKKLTRAQQALMADLYIQTLNKLGRTVHDMGELINTTDLPDHINIAIILGALAEVLGSSLAVVPMPSFQRLVLEKVRKRAGMERD